MNYDSEKYVNWPINGRVVPIVKDSIMSVVSYTFTYLIFYQLETCSKWSSKDIESKNV